MKNTFVNSFISEWLKKRHSFASWLVLLGGVFIPFITIITFLVYPKQLLNIHASEHFWKNMFQDSWQWMAFMLLPMGIVLAVSLITQVEFRNNTWKQLHTAPIPFASIYFSKLFVLLIMMLQLFVLFNIGIYLSAVMPSFFNKRIPFPHYTLDFPFFLQENAKYFILCLPLLSLQYILSLQFRNFLIPIGSGIALVVGGLMALSWEYSYTLPSAYTAIHFLQSKAAVQPEHNLLLWSVGYFIGFTLLGYWMYISKKEKG